MSIIKQDYGEVGGGEPVIEQISGTFVAYQEMAITTNGKPYAFEFSTSGNDTYHALYGDEHPYQNGSIVTAYTLVWGDNTVRFGRTYGSTDYTYSGKALTI